MKNIVASIIVALAAVAPVSSLQASPVGKTTQFASKTFGGFAVGKKFSLKVTALSASSATATGSVTKVAVPAGMPKFKKGQRVNFTIGKKGELKGPGFSIPYNTATDYSNTYLVKPTAKKPKADMAVLRKEINQKVTAATLSFFKTTGSGFGTKVITVVYVLE
ncbi:MAG: hypothetical protein EOP84_03440 [Verrucomicrobiaceae bacterium]|nr:MAG: hypothetical protein EOP84_03440 [Verrucomicrobiaceae bacterium]